ncbi:unnamed protein product [Nezara viridula]|uniref:Odorant receptor n=1 Tax=Nezara viridula TaxID=85310 RepID=A0A9P0HEA7_NEZVI|nr:unnamed protein product [Nezara viridula]
MEDNPASSSLSQRLTELHDDIAVDEYYIRKCMEDNYGLEFWLKAGGLYSIGPNGRLMGKGFYDYQNTLDERCQAFIAKALDESKKKKTMITKAFIAVVMSACVSITILRPIMKFLLGEHRLGTPDDGLLRLLPVTMWTPFNKDSWYVMLMFFLGEEIISYVTPGIVFSFMLLILCTCEDVGTQLVILGRTLKSVVRRAEGLDMPKEEALKFDADDLKRNLRSGRSKSRKSGRPKSKMDLRMRAMNSRTGSAKGQGKNMPPGSRGKARKNSMTKEQFTLNKESSPGPDSKNPPSNEDL